MSSVRFDVALIPLSYQDFSHSFHFCAIKQLTDYPMALFCDEESSLGKQSSNTNRGWTDNVQSACYCETCYCPVHTASITSEQFEAHCRKSSIYCKLIHAFTSKHTCCKCSAAIWESVTASRWFIECQNLTPCPNSEHQSRSYIRCFAQISSENILWMFSWGLTQHILYIIKNQYFMPPYLNSVVTHLENLKSHQIGVPLIPLPLTQLL